jgi:phosphoribosyl-AMP cyclohydrolase
MTEQNNALIDAIKWNSQGLVPAIAQDANSKKVLMMAWINRDALIATFEKGEAVYWSRSRQRLWHKGESSGHIQKIMDIRLDCDGDTLLLSNKSAALLVIPDAKAACTNNILHLMDGSVLKHP